MPHNSLLSAQDYKVAWPVVYVAAVIGFLLSWTVLSGDQFGRVNIFYLLFVYLFIPLASVVISIVSLVNGHGVNLARLLSSIPIWSAQQQSLIRKLQQRNLGKYWFILQSQFAAMTYSLTSLLTFFVLLLATDMSFVWRSTILFATDILPILELLALPWSFWEAAQPSLWLLETTQDSRLLTNPSSDNQYAGWWQFILAIQLFYSFLLRAGLLLGARFWLMRLLKNDLEFRLQSTIQNHPKTEPKAAQLINVTEQLPESVAVNNWAGAPLEILQLLPQLELNEDNLIHAGPYATIAQQTVAERWQGLQLVIVKSWEPPLGELEDFLATGRGFILPVDWQESQLSKPISNHIQEWQRVAEKLPEWQLYLPPELKLASDSDE